MGCGTGTLLELAVERGGDGVEERLAMILGTSIGSLAEARLTAELGSAGWAAVPDEVREELRRHLVDGRVQCNGATWLVTATNPG